MSEKIGFPFAHVAGAITATCIGVGSIVGSVEVNRNDDSLSYAQAQANLGITPSMVDHAGYLQLQAQGARHKLEYTPPNTDCNIKVFDVSTGGCAPERFPDVAGAISDLDNAENALRELGDQEDGQVLSNVKESVMRKDREFRLANFTEPMTTATYSAERTALHDIEPKLKITVDRFEDLNAKARDDSTESFIPGALGAVALGAFGLAAGVGGEAFLEVRKWRRQRNSR